MRVVAIFRVFAKMAQTFRHLLVPASRMPLGGRTVAEDLPMDESPPLDSASGGRQRILPPRAAAHRISYIDEQEKEAADRESGIVRKRRYEVDGINPN